MWIDVALPRQKPRKVFAMSDWNNRNDCQCKHIYFITIHNINVDMHVCKICKTKGPLRFLFVYCPFQIKSSTANFVTFRISCNVLQLSRHLHKLCHGLRQSKAERTKGRVVTSFRTVRESKPLLYMSPDWLCFFYKDPECMAWGLL